MSKLYVQYGAGFSAADGWLNFDASPSLWLERVPLLGRMITVNGNRFPDAVKFGDIVAGLPIRPNTVKAIYASHVLEHLAYDDFWKALKNTYTMLEPGGLFRLIVPDLQERARRYLADAEAGDAEASKRFIEQSYLGRSMRPRSALGRMRALFGNSNHLWMWDEASMRAALAKVGFVDIRRCKFGDAADQKFAAVEQHDRFIDLEFNIEEIAMEARKPEV